MKGTDRAARSVFALMIAIFIFLSSVHLFSYDVFSGSSDDKFAETYNNSNETGYIDCSFSNDGLLLACCLEEKAIIISTTSWEDISQFEIITNQWSFIEISPDKSIIAIAYDKWIHVYNTYSGKLMQNLSGHTSQIFDIEFSPNGFLLASASYEYPIKIWNVSNWSSQEVHLPPGHMKICTKSLDWAEDSNLLYVSPSACYIYIWDVAQKKLIESWNHAGYAILLSNDETKFASYSQNTGELSIFNANTGAIILGFSRDIWDITLVLDWSPNDSAIIARCEYNYQSRPSRDGPERHGIGIWDVSNGKLIQMIEKNVCYCYSYNSRMNMIAISNGSGLDIYENDGDEDSISDRYDAFPHDPAASIDTDKDGAPDEWNPGMTQNNSTTGLYLDAWPTDPAASLDSDGDGYPDMWTPGMGPENSTTGLTRLDDLPYDPSASVDIDGDGWPDEWNIGMGPENSTTNITKLDDFPSEPTQWNDTDEDGWGDNYANLTWGEGRPVGIFIPNAFRPDRYPLDPTQWNDNDGDGYGDNYSGNAPDLFPDDPFEWNDTDGDEVGDNSDADIDNDGWNNTIELEAGTDPYDDSSFPSDTDGDRIPDVFDDDIDNDGWNNTIESELDTDPYDNSSFPSDTDGDGIPDRLDEDDDNDGYSDIVEIEWDTDPMDRKSYPQKPVWLEIPIVEFGGCIFGISFDLSEYILDNDTTVENMVFSVMDYNASCIEVSVSGDRLNIDQVNRSRSEIWLRAFDGLHYEDTNITVIAAGTGLPLPDHDDDGIPDIEDDDIDNDGFNNYVEGLCGTDPYDNQSFPPDMDEDGLPDSLDPDRDGDEVKNENDPYPDDGGKWEEEAKDKKGNSVWWWVVGIVFLLVVLGIVVRLLLVRGKDRDGEGEKKEGG